MVERSCEGPEVASQGGFPEGKIRVQPSFRGALAPLQLLEGPSQSPWSSFEAGFNIPAAQVYLAAVLVECAELSSSAAQFCKGEGGVKAFREKLQLFRVTLQEYQFLGGTSPCYGDMYLLAAFMVRIPGCMLTRMAF